MLDYTNSTKEYVTLSPKERAQKLYNDAYNRWCYEISHEKNVLTARDIAHYMVDRILEVVSPFKVSYWKKVKQEINKL